MACALFAIKSSSSRYSTCLSKGTHMTVQKVCWVGREEEVAAASLPKMASAVLPYDSHCIISPDKARAEKPQLSICGWVCPHLQVGGVAGGALIGRCWGCCSSSLVLAGSLGLSVMVGLRMDFSMLLEPLGLVKVLEWVSGA